jgi:hypothetical protein
MIAQSRLKQAISYDSFSGEFKRISNQSGPIEPIKCGSVHTGSHGYKCLVICIDGRRYKASRLAWLFVTGSFPDDQIDHIDGDSLNNAFINLRQATTQENSKNRRIYKNNSSGIAGISWVKRLNKWQSRISIDSRVVHIGVFDTLIDAVCSRKRAERINNYHKNHGSAIPTKNNG